MSTVRKGGGHSRGQTMPYAVVYAWEGGKPSRKSVWTIGAAEEAMYETLRAANFREADIEIKVIDRATGETVIAPQLCVVCGERWATEPGFTRGDTAMSLCTEDQDADEPDGGQELDADDRTAVSRLAAGAGLIEQASVPSSLVAPLVTALRAKGLEPVALRDGSVTVTAHGIDWTLEPVPHAVTGGWCGVWSAVGPQGSRGQFVAANAASFVAGRRVP